VTWAWIDKYVGRWTNVWFNVALLVVMGGVALFMDRGWARDMWMFAAGANFGYAFMWLTYPRFTAARQREMEEEMDRILQAGLWRMTRETLGFMTRAEADEENKRTLQ
jgi:hypothetical protein